MTVEHGNEIKLTGEKAERRAEQANFPTGFPIGFGRVARSYYGGSGRKIGVFLE